MSDLTSSLPQQPPLLDDFVTPPLPSSSTDNTNTNEPTTVNTTNGYNSNNVDDLLLGGTEMTSSSTTGYPGATSASQTPGRSYPVSNPLLPTTTSTTTATQHSIHQKVLSIMFKYCPNKANDVTVNRMIEKYAGKEDQLLEALQKKYSGSAEDLNYEELIREMIIAQDNPNLNNNHPTAAASTETSSGSVLQIPLLETSSSNNNNNSNKNNNSSTSPVVNIVSDSGTSGKESFSVSVRSSIFKFIWMFLVFVGLIIGVVSLITEFAGKGGKLAIIIIFGILYLLTLVFGAPRYVRISKQAGSPQVSIYVFTIVLPLVFIKSFTVDNITNMEYTFQAWTTKHKRKKGGTRSVHHSALIINGIALISCEEADLSEVSAAIGRAPNMKTGPGQVSPSRTVCWFSVCDCTML